MNKLGIKNISYIEKTNSYMVQIKRHKVKYSNQFKTLDKAIEWRDQIILNLSVDNN